MKILDFLNKKAISPNIKATEKKEVLEELVDLLLKSEVIDKSDRDSLVKTLLNRESLGSTGIGQNIGIPHGRTNAVKELVAAFGVSKDGVNFDSLDGEPVYLFFLLVAPEDATGSHLKALARISRLLKDKYIREILCKAKDEKTILNIFKVEDDKEKLV